MSSSCMHCATDAQHTAAGRTHFGDSRASSTKRTISYQMLRRLTVPGECSTQRAHAIPRSALKCRNCRSSTQRRLALLSQIERGILFPSVLESSDDAEMRSISWRQQEYLQYHSADTLTHCVLQASKRRDSRFRTGTAGSGKLNGRPAGPASL